MFISIPSAVPSILLIQPPGSNDLSFYKPCPSCGESILFYRNPTPTVDIIIFSPPDKIVLVERKNFPFGWALPGGFIDYGEKAEHAAVREALEETGLNVVLTGISGVYSMPYRDPRSHTLSIVYTAFSTNPEDLKPGDDAGKAEFFSWSSLPETAFDHAQIIQDFKMAQSRLDSRI